MSREVNVMCTQTFKATEDMLRELIPPGKILLYNVGFVPQFAIKILSESGPFPKSKIRWQLLIVTGLNQAITVKPPVSGSK